MERTSALGHAHVGFAVDGDCVSTHVLFRVSIHDELCRRHGLVEPTGWTRQGAHCGSGNHVISKSAAGKEMVMMTLVW